MMTPSLALGVDGSVGEQRISISLRRGNSGIELCGPWTRPTGRHQACDPQGKPRAGRRRARHATSMPRTRALRQRRRRRSNSTVAAPCADLQQKSEPAKPNPGTILGMRQVQSSVMTA